MALDLEPRFTFDAFVVGPANRLAAAAARRVAESPGTTYNPLFIYSGSGLGKTHLLGAIGHQVERVHDLPVLYDTTERLLEAIRTAVEAGERDAFRGRLRNVSMLLLDDVQFLAGQRQIQEELLRAWDDLAAAGAQVVLTSDRPPQEIDALDDRLLSRLSGGLIVDMGAPDFETRIAIVRRKAGERGISLSQDIFQEVARIAFTNVRELQGALNRLIAVQELEERQVSSEEVTGLLGTAAERGRDEFGEFLSAITGTVGEVVEQAEQRIADAILTWEAEGYRTRRLDSALTGTMTLAQAEEVVDRFERDVRRLEGIREQIRELDPVAPELNSDVLRDPDRMAEAETVLRSVRHRRQPPPAPPGGPGLDALDGESLAVRAARAVAEEPGTAYNPLYILAPAGPERSELLKALANTLQGEGLAVAYLDGDAFAQELIAALERSGLEGWRERYRRAEALILDDLDELAGMERGHEELFHLFEKLHKASRQLVFAAAVAPAKLPFPSRLQSRLESGLVVELEPGDRGGDAKPHRPPAEPSSPSPRPGDGAGDETERGAARSGASRSSSHWLLSQEKVLWEWPYGVDWIEESPD